MGGFSREKKRSTTFFIQSIKETSIGEQRANLPPTKPSHLNLFFPARSRFFFPSRAWRLLSMDAKTMIGAPQGGGGKGVKDVHGVFVCVWVETCLFSVGLSVSKRLLP